MKLERVDYRELGKRIGNILLVNKVVITAVVMLAVGVLVLQRINQLTEPEVDSAHLKEQINSVDEVVFDEEAITQITELQETNIEITSEFTDRDNPFVD